MVTRIVPRLLPLLLFLAATAARAGPDTPGAAAFDHGYFCALVPVGEEVAENTVSGTVAFVQARPVFLRRGPLVPAQRGVSFGVHVQVLPQYAGLVTIQIAHPPMGPNGVTEQTWVSELSGEDLQYLGYTFDFDYELLPGIWTMSAEAQGRLIYSVDFEVIDALLLPPVICEGVPVS